MNPLVSKWVGSLVRAAVLAIGASGPEWSDGEVDQIVNALMVLVPVVWGLWEKYKSQQQSNTTLAVMNQLTGPGVPSITQSDIKAVIAQGDAAPAATPKDEAPVLKGDGDGMERLKRATARF